jgi:NAD(P)-dependent dehydrogenase (short-subunit alcohol dehydrogenase family)
MTIHQSRTALITGASRGLGLALARQLATEGWQLIIDARGAEALEAARAALAKQTRVIAIPGDVTDPAHRRAIAEAARKLGGLDALINNASFLGPSPQPPLLDYPLDVLERVYRTNVIAPLALTQAVRHELKPGACVINITSDAGVEAYEGWGGYGSSKAALETVTDSEGMMHPGEGWTRLVITPQRGLRAVNAMLTSLHEPYSTHLAMLEALCGLEHLKITYQEALRKRYLWHEFGDLHLILP